MQNFKISKDDIFRIGQSFLKDENGNLVISCKRELADMQALFLRVVLKDFGSQYKIIEEPECVARDEYGHFYECVDLITNLPMKLVCPKCTEEDEKNG